ncbi:MAG: carboxyl transferase domain-containing protein, partial [Pseudomonadales bacterium]
MSTTNAILKSKINTQSADFQRNSNAMQALVDDLAQKVSAIKQGGGEQYQQRHKARGKLLVRERVDALIDPGSPFLEISQLAAYEVYQEEVNCAGVVAGIAR